MHTALGSVPPAAVRSENAFWRDRLSVGGEKKGHWVRLTTAWGTAQNQTKGRRVALPAAWGAQQDQTKGHCGLSTAATGTPQGLSPGLCHQGRAPLQSKEPIGQRRAAARASGEAWGGGAAAGPTPGPGSPAISAAAGPTGLRARLEAFSAAAVNLFPVWVCLGCIVALVRPQLFSWIQGRIIVIGLAATMLGMGFTLSLDDLGAALAMPRELIAGVLLQYTVMPSMGFLISRIPWLPSEFAVGLILVSCCPGGTASNIVTYLARGNVALSVLMTAASTMLAVVMTPLLTSLLAGQLVPVDGRALFMSTLQVVLLPVCAGSILSRLFPAAIAAISPYSALVAVVTVALIVGSGISTSAVPLAQSSGATSAGSASTALLLASLVFSVVLLHSAGFLLGYMLPKFGLGLGESESRTISIEVGMQNSILGVVLATQHFSSPLVAGPSAVSAVCHSVLGSLLASYWRSKHTTRAENSP